MQLLFDELSTSFGGPVSICARAAAIDERLLIDMNTIAREASFRIHVAMTLAEWDDCGAWTGQRLQASNAARRIRSTVWGAMAYIAARDAKGDRRPFRFYWIARGGRSTTPRRTTLHLHIGAGDGGEPLFTILTPNEDCRW